MLSNFYARLARLLSDVQRHETMETHFATIQRRSQLKLAAAGLVSAAALIKKPAPAAVLLGLYALYYRFYCHPIFDLSWGDQDGSARAEIPNLGAAVKFKPAAKL